MYYVREWKLGEKTEVTEDPCLGCLVDQPTLGTVMPIEKRDKIKIAVKPTA